MRLHRKIVHSHFVQSLLCGLVACYVHFVYYTSRWTIRGRDIAYGYDQKDFGNAIFAFWHSRLLLMPKFRPKGRDMYVIISVHSDGEIIARAIEFFNFRLIRGSSRKGGVAALIKARKHLRQGNNIAITPDGPKGPRMRVNSNIIGLAKMTGKPVIPVTFSTSRARVLKSWDRFLLALPFGKAVVIFGNPITVGNECSEKEMKALTLQLETELNRITAEADLFVGLEPVMPAELKKVG